MLSNIYVQAGQEVDMEALVDGNNAFAFDLYAKLRDEPGNLFFSPYSISTALAMTYAGARENTAQQMAEVLHFILDQDKLHPAFARLSEHFKEIQAKGEVALNVANALWLQQNYQVLQKFLNVLKSLYKTRLFQVNFKEAYEEARVRINAWVAEQTNAKIQNLIPPGVLNELTRLVLTNAIYFKGNWASQFGKDLTDAEPFWVTPEQKVMVPMMYQKASFKYGEDDFLQTLEMPYAGEDLSMIILLPKEKNGLPELEQCLHGEPLDAWLSEAAYREVDVYFPKFKMTSQFSLTATLKMMGMTDAFSRDADFSGIEPTKQLCITDVIHKAFVEVNEEGTEAAAATAVVIGVTSVAEPVPVPIFKADHPFLFLIKDNEFGSTLFLGRVVNPGD